MIATQKLQGYAYYWFECLSRDRALPIKPKIKTWSKLKSHIDVLLNPYQLIEEELFKEKLIFLQEKIFVQEENEPILGFDEARESLPMNESFLKTPIQVDFTLVFLSQKLWRFKFKFKN